MTRGILWFKECSYDNINLVGGKNSSLGELQRMSQVLGFNTANGFAITTEFYLEYLSSNGLSSLLLPQDIDTDDIEQLTDKCQAIRDSIVSGEFTPEQEELIRDNYGKLSDFYNTEEIEVAVRSSSVAEDLPDASFAGQQDTYLNILGVTNILAAVKECMASLFTARAVSYRKNHNISVDSVKISVGIQKMVRSDLSSAGVAFSLDPETGYSRAIIINSSYGLGESVVSGAVRPDEIILDKRTLHVPTADPIIMKKIGDKDTKVIYGNSGTVSASVSTVETTERERMSFSLTNNQAITIARIVSKLEDKYTKLGSSPDSLDSRNPSLDSLADIPDSSARGSSPAAIDVEWAIDGISQKIYIIQARPETVHRQDYQGQGALVVKRYILDNPPVSLPLITGVSVGNKISSGRVCVLSSMKEHAQFVTGDILVTDMTTPDWEPLMRRASGIVTNKGGRTCHAAIVARELGVNAVVGTGRATEVLKLKQDQDLHVTLVSSSGEKGYVYDTELPYTLHTVDVNATEKLPVDLMFNIGDPDNSFSASLLPNAGVGLVRIEFIISNYIGIHPMALYHYPNLDPELRKDIHNKIGEHDDGKWFFIKRLARGISKISSAFYPKPVIVRLSDFKSNEYRNLIGGEHYEPTEENPMIGWRGASRYYSADYGDAFELECKGIKYAREVMMMDNIIVMIPFCRTPEECEQVLAVMERNGLTRGPLKIYLMCEIPSNIIEADRFAPYVDGVSIGGNDLLQLTLGIDRDCDRITYLSNHTNISYRRLISQAIKKYREYGIKVGFCGQQPSYSTEFAHFLADEGIDSISVIPDSLSDIVQSFQPAQEFREEEV